MRTVQVEVTQADINTALALDGMHDCSNCPVALALHRTLGTPVEVGARSFGIRGQNFEGMLPESTVQFIRQFDEGKPVSPFTFTVEVLDNDQQAE